MTVVLGSPRSTERACRKHCKDRVALVTGAGQEHRPRHRAHPGARRRDGAGQRTQRPRGGRSVVDEIEAAGGKAQAAMGDVSDPGDRAEARQAGRGAGRRRHPGEQRRPAPPDLVPRHVVRGMARDHVGGARRRLPARQGVRAADGGQGQRRRLRRHVGHLDPCRHAQPLPRLGVEVGPRRADARAGARAGAAQDHLQRSVARRHRHQRAPPRRGPRRRSQGRPIPLGASARSTRSPPWSACWSGRKAPSSPARPSM